MELITITNLNYKEKYEGLKIIMKAIKDLPVKLKVLGDGKYRDHLEQQDNVEFLGHIKDVKPYLRKADCFVYCSFLDSWGTVLLEAQKEGLPIILNDLPSFRESCPYGIYVPALLDGFRIAIKKFLSDPECFKSESLRGQAYANTLTWDKTARQYVKVWRQITSK